MPNFIRDSAVRLQIDRLGAMGRFCSDIASQGVCWGIGSLAIGEQTFFEASLGIRHQQALPVLVAQRCTLQARDVGESPSINGLGRWRNPSALNRVVGAKLLVGFVVVLDDDLDEDPVGLCERMDGGFLALALGRSRLRCQRPVSIGAGHLLLHPVLQLPDKALDDGLAIGTLRRQKRHL
jgi:hypothetical protein